MRASRLHRVYPAVYAVGHAAVSAHGRYLAAVLYAGAGAVLSHGAAAFVLGVGPARRAPEPEVTGPRERRYVAVHRHRLHPLERSVLDGIPITTVPRLLVDLAAGLVVDDLARACHDAWVHHRTTPEMVELVIDRAHNRPGAGILRRLLRGDEPALLSRLERRFLTLLREQGLPLPVTNRHVGGDRVDCHWPQQRLVVELVSYRFHATRQAFEADLRRARTARAAGLEHRRYGWGDVAEDPAPMLAELRRLLS